MCQHIKSHCIFQHSIRVMEKLRDHRMSAVLRYSDDFENLIHYFSIFKVVGISPILRRIPAIASIASSILSEDDIKQDRP